MLSFICYCILTGIFCLVLFTMPNITITFSDYTPSTIILFILICLMIIASCVPATKYTSVTLFGLICSIISLSILVYSVLTFVSWFSSTREGIYQSRNLTLIKTVSLELKLQQYHISMVECLRIIKSTALEKGLYIEGLPYITNPPMSVIMKTSLDHMSTFAHTFIEKGVLNTSVISSTQGTSKGTVKKILLGVAVFGALISFGYAFGIFSFKPWAATITQITISEAQMNASDTQSSAAIAESLTKILPCLIDCADCIKTLGNKSILLDQEVTLLKEGIIALQNEVMNLTVNMETTEQALFITKKTLRFIVHIAIKNPSQILNILQQPNIAYMVGHLPPGILETVKP